MKTIYKNIYAFEAIDKIKAGESVYVADKKMLSCSLVGDMTVFQLVGMLLESDKDTGRFCFWIEVREEE